MVLSDRQCTAHVEILLNGHARYQWLKESLWARRSAGALEMREFNELPRNRAGEYFHHMFVIGKCGNQLGER